MLDGRKTDDLSMLFHNVMCRSVFFMDLMEESVCLLEIITFYNIFYMVLNN